MCTYFLRGPLRRCVDDRFVWCSNERNEIGGAADAGGLLGGVLRVNFRKQENGVLET